MTINELRQGYLQRVCREIIRKQRDNSGVIEFPNFADGTNKTSVKIAWGILRQLGCDPELGKFGWQTIGKFFELITKDFVEEAFSLLNHLRPGEWRYYVRAPISNFDQYSHLAQLENIVKQDRDLFSALGGDYTVTPDIVVGRMPPSDQAINFAYELWHEGDAIANLTSLRRVNHEPSHLLLQACISCEWKIRDRSSLKSHREALILVHHRIGRLPHIVAVTAEPLPTRIKTLALGTGDLDCVYHFALHELQFSVIETNNTEQIDLLNMLVEGRRLRDISDLPFDLAI